MRRFGKVCTLAVLVFGLSAAVAMADEQKVPLSQVPKAVTEAFKAKFPKASIKNAIKEDDRGRVTYEIESTVQGGLSIDAVLKPDGQFVAIEKQIKTSDLPAAVAAGVKSRYPKARLTKAEEVHKDGKISYEVTVKKGDGKTAVLAFDKDGKFLEEE
jgi:hypothetical protein